ncbi:MAG: hypothetical protein AB8G14_02255 [Ilumatobacter sp.]
MKNTLTSKILLAAAIGTFTMGAAACTSDGVDDPIDDPIDAPTDDGTDTPVDDVIEEPIDDEG